MSRQSYRFGRRTLLQNGTLLLSAPMAVPRAFSSEGALAEEEVAADDDSIAVRLGLLTDLHYADKEAKGSRFYRETLDKLAVAKAQLKSEQPDFLVELGDLVDAADSVEVELGYLHRVNDLLASICPQRHYVLGNHCVHTLTKDEFLGAVGQRRSYYSFDQGEFHFVVLDSCFRGDGKPYGRKNFEWTDPNVPAHELQWLKDGLAANTKKTVVFAHQRLDVSNNHGVKNAMAVRRILEESGDVLAVIQGHSHKNDLKTINGIHYCTLVAMVEGSGTDSSGFALMSIAKNGAIQIEGFARQSDYQWSA